MAGMVLAVPLFGDQAEKMSPIIKLLKSLPHF